MFAKNVFKHMFARFEMPMRYLKRGSSFVSVKKVGNRGGIYFTEVFSGFSKSVTFRENERLIAASFFGDLERSICKPKPGVRFS